MRALMAMLFFTVTWSAFGDIQEPILRPRDALRGVVKVFNLQAHPFSSESGSAHGTGFLVSVEKGKGYIFTNKHVVDKDGTLEVQKLVLSIPTATKVPETIPARISFISQIHDFAVLEFDYNQLERAKKLQPLPLPEEGSPWLDFVENFEDLQGKHVYAVGNPFDSESVITFGQVTALKMDSIKGPIIQNQTPINPGNSGGPLISEETGEVVGINVSIIEGANLACFSIPIGDLIREWQQSKAQASFGHPKTIFAYFAQMGLGKLKLSGLDQKIEELQPNFFDHFDKVLAVEDSDPASKFKRGDILFSVEGQIIGDSFYEFRWLRQRAEGSLDVQVIRNGALLDLSVPVNNASFSLRRIELDYVYISGLLFRQVDPLEAWLIHGRQDMRVKIGELLDTPDVNFSSEEIPHPDSFIEAVSFGEREYPIHTLLDLKNALNENRNAESMWLSVREALKMKSPEGQLRTVHQHHGPQAIGSLTTTYMIPISEVLTPRNFSLHQFRRQFAFEKEKFKTRHWRRFIHQRDNCGRFLSDDEG